jgi:hypothetical protein
LNASMTKTLASGKYYISIEGTGAGDPVTGGYSDYASIGSYSITGTIATTTLTNTQFNSLPDFTIFPNPSSSHILEMNGVLSGMSYEIRDVLGNLKLKKQIISVNEKIDASSLSSGIYIISVKNLIGTTSKKIILL